MTDTAPTVLIAKAIVPDHVLFQEVMGNSALLNLETETYFGLDDVGTRMWEAIVDAPTVGDAARTLAEYYDAPSETIEHDLLQLVSELRRGGLLDLANQGENA